VQSGSKAAEEVKRRVARSRESVRFMKLATGCLAIGFGGRLRIHKTVRVIKPYSRPSRHF
jgi:hypothetical protein